MTNLNVLLDKNIRLYVIATGAGAGFQKDLWEVPGCSSYLVGAEFPYDTAKTSRLLGFTPEHFVSEETSIELAMKAYMEAYNPEVNVDDVVGVGLTASVASTKEHRGDHRIIVTVITNKTCLTTSAVIQKGAGEHYRIEDGEIADDMANVALLTALGIPATHEDRSSENMLSCNTVTHSNEQLVNMIMKRPYFKADGTRDKYFQLGEYKPASRKLELFAAGSYNPLHYGHVGCAEAAKREIIADINCDVELIYNTCINPKHKSQVTFTELLQKIVQFRGKNYLLTQDDALYIDKAKAFPGSYFVIGADSVITMMDPKWYSSPDEFEQMMDQFALKYKVHFCVADRLVNDQCISLQDLKNKYPLLDKYFYLFRPIRGRWDISSTELRNLKVKNAK